MIEGLPAYVSPRFIATTFLTVGFLFYAIKRTTAETLPGRSVLFLTPFWMIFVGIIAIGGFYQVTETLPPRIFAFGALPAILLGVLLVVLFPTFTNSLPLTVLTLLHVIRLPIELVLYWLAHSGSIPQLMTFEGSNFDILSGITAPLVYLVAFRGGRTNRPLLIIWNIAALLLLITYFVVFSIGEALWSARFLEYASELAPPGRIAQYMGLANIPWLLAKGTTGFYSGLMLKNYCPEGAPAADLNTGTMWFWYACIAMMSPIGLWLARKWVMKGLHTKSAA